MISDTFKQVEVVQTMFKQVGIKEKVRVGKLNVGILCFKVSTKPDRKKDSQEKSYYRFFSPVAPYNHQIQISQNRWSRGLEICILTNGLHF